MWLLLLSRMCRQEVLNALIHDGKPSLLIKCVLLSGRILFIHILLFTRPFRGLEVLFFFFNSISKHWIELIQAGIVSDLPLIFPTCIIKEKCIIKSPLLNHKGRLW